MGELVFNIVVLCVVVVVCLLTKYNGKPKRSIGVYDLTNKEKIQLRDHLAKLEESEDDEAIKAYLRDEIESIEREIYSY